MYFGVDDGAGDEVGAVDGTIEGDGKGAASRASTSSDRAVDFKSASGAIPIFEVTCRSWAFGDVRRNAVKLAKVFMTDIAHEHWGVCGVQFGSQVAVDPHWDRQNWYTSSGCKVRTTPAARASELRPVTALPFEGIWANALPPAKLTRTKTITEKQTAFFIQLTPPSDIGSASYLNGLVFGAIRSNKKTQEFHAAASLTWTGFMQTEAISGAPPMIL